MDQSLFSGLLFKGGKSNFLVGSVKKTGHLYSAINKGVFLSVWRWKTETLKKMY